MTSAARGDRVQDAEMRARRRPGRIGPWRLLDLMHASMSWRAHGLAGGALPEFGPPDAPAPRIEPDELPGSNIGDGEQRAAIARERARRFVRTRAAVR